ncbi:MAG TPA: DUF742 domain-containing protein [Trebonia sp.]|jgi:hypothetical protein|nr:DUF742 domain-containing protein [Trebonia sp.]
MNRRSIDREAPDRLYTVTGGRVLGDDDPFDLVSLIVAERDPAPGMQSEHARILVLCRAPMAVVEVSAELRLPVSVVKVLLLDLLDTGGITVRHPLPAPARAAGPSGLHLPDRDVLRQVLHGLQRL